MSSFHPLPLHPAVSARSIPLPCKQKIVGLFTPPPTPPCRQGDFASVLNTRLL